MGSLDMDLRKNGIAYDIPGRPAGGAAKEPKLLDKKTTPEGLSYRDTVAILKQEVASGNKTPEMARRLRVIIQLIETAFGVGITPDEYDKNVADGTALRDEADKLLKIVEAALVVPAPPVVSPPPGGPPGPGPGTSEPWLIPENERKAINKFEEVLEAWGCPREILWGKEKAEEQRSFFWTKLFYDLRAKTTPNSLTSGFVELKLGSGTNTVNIEAVVDEFGAKRPGSKSEVREKLRMDFQVFEIIYGKSRKAFDSAKSLDKIIEHYRETSGGTYLDKWFWDALMDLPKFYVVNEHGDLVTKEVAGKQEPVLDEETMHSKLFVAVREQIRKGRELDPQNRQRWRAKEPEKVGSNEKKFRMAWMWKKINGIAEFVHRPLSFKNTPETSILPIAHDAPNYGKRRNSYDKLIKEELRTPTVQRAMDEEVAANIAHPGSRPKVIDIGAETAAFLGISLNEIAGESLYQDAHGESSFGAPRAVWLYNWQYFYKLIRNGTVDTSALAAEGQATQLGRPNPNVIGGYRSYGWTFWDYFGVDGQSLTQRILSNNDRVKGFKVIPWDRLPANATSRFGEAMKVFTAIFSIQHDGFKSGRIDDVVQIDIAKGRSTIKTLFLQDYLEFYRNVVGYMINSHAAMPFQLDPETYTNEPDPSPGSTPGARRPKPGATTPDKINYAGGRALKTGEAPPAPPENGLPTGDYVRFRTAGVNGSGRPVYSDPLFSRMFEMNQWQNPETLAQWVDMEKEGNGNPPSYDVQYATYPELLQLGYKEEDILLPTVEFTDVNLQDETHSLGMAAKSRLGHLANAVEAAAQRTRLLSLRSQLLSGARDVDLTNAGFSMDEIKGVRKTQVLFFDVLTNKKVDKGAQLVQPVTLMERQKITEVVYSANAESDAIRRINPDELFILAVMFCPEAVKKYEEGYLLGPIGAVQMKLQRKIPFFGKYFEQEALNITPTPTHTWTTFKKMASRWGYELTKSDIADAGKLFGLNIEN